MARGPQPKKKPSRAGLAAALAAAAAAVVLLLWRSSAPTPADEKPPLEYVEAGACRDCHIDIWNSSMRTGMGRSFYKLRGDNLVETWNGPEFRHEASNRLYAMIERDERYFQRRRQIGPGGADENVYEKEIHYVMGSGNRVRTYLHRKTNGEIVELPLAWYPEGGGRWGMNPGYDQPRHEGFQRLVGFDCMFCHNGYPEMAPGADRAGRPVVYPEKLPQGIDCQRCHGPGAEHLLALQRNEPAERVRASIGNPARLAPERQLDVCYQCHMETTSRPLPNVLHRYGRGVFSFRPGEPLADSMLHFDHPPGAGWDDKFEINHSAYRLRQAACFQASEGRLLCTTCHDPHGAPVTRSMAAVCGECHAASGPGHPAGEDCAACHMPKRRTDDVVLAVMTDHRIQRRPPPGDLLAPKRERPAAELLHRGDVPAYYPAPLAPADAPYGALALIAQDADRAEGVRRLEAAADLPAETLYELASAYERDGRPAEAAATFGEALALDPSLTIARRRRGAALAAAEDTGAALAELAHARQEAPGDARVRRETGLVLAGFERYSEAAAEFQAAIELDPDLPENHNNLGGALLQLGRADEAERAFREAVRIQPDLAEAQFNLGNLAAGHGDAAEAERRWRLALAGDPDFASASYNLGISLANAGRLAEARERLRRAVRSKDPAVRQAAEAALAELR